MQSVDNNLFFSLTPKTEEKQTIKVKGVRFSVLSDCLLRIEYQKDNKFCDLATQSVINRSFDNPEFNYKIIGDYVIINTDKTEFVYNTISHSMESVTLSDGRKITDYTKGNLKGTCRTLDGVNGKTKLEDGIISKNGVAVFDDSNSLVITDNGDVLPRPHNENDIYYFAFGYNYREAVKTLFKLTGAPPLIPKFTLGNWWSRYKAYTQDEYQELMNRFIDEEIPITVATIDMDWHWVDVVKKFGRDALDDKQKNSIYELFYNTVFPGWTGYSWNTELFPDPKGFLSWLKEKGFKITMNLHPASGCKFYEDAYSDFCEYLSIDKYSKQQIKFDLSDKRFMEGYFKFLHHPHEKDGVDFWWIDWQQGKNSSIPGLDPLWALNHYHSIDITRDEKRPLILSRFAGAGSHRYPLGFSGDTVQTWKSLNFQPYFTSTASNIGYSWWSHDIGGHCRGYRDDELYLRWVQYGVFSPIMRLHSTSNEFMGKEPWMYNKFVYENAVKFLRLRHRLIPYLYSMNRLTATQGRCLIEPMYYENPRDARAYEAPNEYYFGTELIVCPITEKCDSKTGLAGTTVYLPKGRYIDIFTGRIYNGNTLTKLFRDASSIPVLAKEGAIIPLSDSYKTNDISNPESLEIIITRGNGNFVLYEDDGESLAYQSEDFCETEFTVTSNEGNLSFNISPVNGNNKLVPQKRKFRLNFIDIADCESAEIYINDNIIYANTKKHKGSLLIEINAVSPKDSVKVKLNKFVSRKNQSKQQYITELISKYKGGNENKTLKYNLSKINKMLSLFPKELNNALNELNDMIF